jgi:hypothetical protein
VLDAIKKINELNKRALNLDMSDVAEIAYVYSETGFFANRAEFKVVSRDKKYNARRKGWDMNFFRKSPLFGNMFLERLYIGAPVDFLDLQDLLKGDAAKRYKVLVFLNACDLTTSERAELKRKVQTDGKIVLWLYGSGFMNRGKKMKSSVEYMKELTGFDFELENRAFYMGMKVIDNLGPVMKPGFEIKNFAHPFTSGLKDFGATKYEINDIGYNPKFVVGKSKEIFPVAEYEDGGGVGVAVRKFKYWISVYVGQFTAPSYLIRHFAKEANVNIYNLDEHYLAVNKSFLMIHATKSGVTRINLPRPSFVYDCLKNKIVSKETRSFEINLTVPTTKIFYIGNEKEWIASTTLDSPN